MALDLTFLQLGSRLLILLIAIMGVGGCLPETDKDIDAAAEAENTAEVYFYSDQLSYNLYLLSEETQFLEIGFQIEGVTSEEIVIEIVDLPADSLVSDFYYRLSSDNSSGSILLDVIAPVVDNTADFYEDLVFRFCKDEECRLVFEDAEMPIYIDINVEPDESYGDLDEEFDVYSNSKDLDFYSDLPNTITQLRHSFTLDVFGAELEDLVWEVEFDSSVIESLDVSIEADELWVDLVLVSPWDLGGGYYYGDFDITFCIREKCTWEEKVSISDSVWHRVIDYNPLVAITQPLPVVSRSALAHDIRDAIYSPRLDALLMASGEPRNALYVRYLTNNVQYEIGLTRKPISIAILESSNRTRIAVGQDARVSLVEYSDVNPASSSITEYSIPVKIYDLVLTDTKILGVPTTGNGAYLHQVNINANTYTLSSGGFISPFSNIVLHPDHQTAYTASNSIIANFEITGATPHREYGFGIDTCWGLWMFDDGNRVMTSCGNSYITSNNIGTDLDYDGALDLTTWSSSYSNTKYAIKAFDYSASHNKIVAIEEQPDDCDDNDDEEPTCSTGIRFFDSNLSSIGKQYQLPNWNTGDYFVKEIADWAFFRDSTSTISLLSHIDHGDEPAYLLSANIP